MADTKRRRKSLSIFGYAPSPLTPVTTITNAPSADASAKASRTETFPMAGASRPKSIPASIFSRRSSTQSVPASPVFETKSSSSLEQSESPKLRPRVLHKGARASVFGSLRSLRSLEDEERLTLAASKASSLEDEELVVPGRLKGLFGEHVLHYGEVQTGNMMFRKKTQYLVLTESHLLRFKSQSRAAEMFPSIPASLGRSSMSRQSFTSVTSYKDVETALLGDILTGIALNHVIAVSKLDDGRPYFSMEISHLDDISGHHATMHMQLNDPREAELWLKAIRTASKTAREKDQQMFPALVLQRVAHAIELERDYDPNHFRIFKVVRRASAKMVGRSSTDDITKHSSSIYYLVIGINRIHLIPPLRGTKGVSSTSLSEFDPATSYGVLSLASFVMHEGDDTFQMTFRVPTRGSFTVHFASCDVENIALWIRHRTEYLRPAWIQQPIHFNVPLILEDQEIPVPPVDEDYDCFDRTLIAHCSAFDLDPSRIRYSVDHECEDEPCFRLLPASGNSYHPLELVALMRSLRYNETFGSISFHGINLDALQTLYDPYGVDLDGTLTRQGQAMHIEGHANLSILSQEVRALAAKSKRLRRLDFSFCLTRVPEEGNGHRSNACGLPEAVMPLCKRSLTNVDWLVLNGIKLGESDLDYLVDAASERTCHLRALEVSDCGLSVHDLDVLLSTLSVQESTLEVINIAGIQGRISPEIFQKQISYFPHLRRINLTRVQKMAGAEPLIAPDTLIAWRLEELSLSQSPIGEKMLHALVAYLASPQSETLRELRLDQCALTGYDLALILAAVPRKEGIRRPMHLSASENRLHVGYSALFEAIGQNKSPSHLTMRMIEFEKERHFQELVVALRKNTSLISLDISKASIPYDATAETCDILQRCFATNNTLKELDISGDHSHLDAARFGIGLNHALTGLKSNTSLQILRIEHQNLGLQGANTLADVLEHNTALREVYCENNEITLQCFTALLNGLQKNRYLLYLPALERDRDACLAKVNREIKLMNQSNDGLSQAQANPLRRTLSLVGASKGSRPGSSYGKSNVSPSKLSSKNSSKAVSSAEQDAVATVSALKTQWDIEAARLHGYLMRNNCIANGLPFDDDKLTGPIRPAAAVAARALADISNVKAGLHDENISVASSSADDDEGLTMKYLEISEKLDINK